MTIDLINLRKILKFCQLPNDRLESALRREVYEDRKRADFPEGGGGDFHAPFWSDVKNSVFHGLDLAEATCDRIARNDRRSRLYPILTQKFLEWWREFQRQTNEVSMPIEERVHARHLFEELAVIVKVDNLLSLQSSSGRHQLIYPYFSELPHLDVTWARVGLWIMAKSLEDYEPSAMIILDLHRAKSFSVREHPFKGDESKIFSERIREIRKAWEKLLVEAEAK